MLYLNPAETSERLLSGRLVTASLSADSYLSYDAISWAWGKCQAQSFVSIDGQRCSIPRRLDHCLRSLLGSSPSHPCFWVDALCVDQFNPREREQQVKLMDQIFYRANGVFVWLDRDEGWSETVSEVYHLRSLEDIRKFEPLVSFAFCQALASDWWKRLWPMQEVVLASDLQLCFDVGGRARMHMSCVRALIRWCEPFEEKSHQFGYEPDEMLRQLQEEHDMAKTEKWPNRSKHTVLRSDRRQQRSNHGVDSPSRFWLQALNCLERLQWLKDLRRRIPPLIDSASMNLIASSDDLRRRAYESSLIIYESRLAGTTDARDRVYGLLGVCAYLFGSDFLNPSYDQPTDLVYTKFAKRLYQRTGSLVFLNQVCPFTHTESNLPSWVPDLGSRYDHRCERQRLNNWFMYHASARVDQWASIQRFRNNKQKEDPVRGHDLEDEAMLQCQGVEFSAVTIPCAGLYDGTTTLGSPAMMMDIISSWKDSFEEACQDVNHKTRQIAFAHTLVRSLAEDCTVITREEDAIEDAKILIGDLRNHATTFTVNGAADTDLSSLPFAYWRCYHHLKDQRFFIADNGFVGLGPLDVQSGDTLAVLAGGNVPYVLRKCEQFPDSKDEVKRFFV